MSSAQAAALAAFKANGTDKKKAPLRINTDVQPSRGKSTPVLRTPIATPRTTSPQRSPPKDNGVTKEKELRRKDEKDPTKNDAKRGLDKQEETTKIAQAAQTNRAAPTNQTAKTAQPSQTAPTKTTPQSSSNVAKSKPSTQTASKPNTPSQPSPNHSNTLSVKVSHTKTPSTSTICSHKSPSTPTVYKMPRAGSPQKSPNAMASAAGNVAVKLSHIPKEDTVNNDAVAAANTANTSNSNVSVSSIDTKRRSFGPRDMIAHVKQSISARAAKSREMGQKSPDLSMIEGIRRSIDSKYIFTSTPALGSEDGLHAAFFNHSFNPSYSSLDSAVSEPSVVDEGGKEMEDKGKEMGETGKEIEEIKGKEIEEIKGKEISDGRMEDCNEKNETRKERNDDPRKTGRVGSSRSSLSCSRSNKSDMYSLERPMFDRRSTEIYSLRSHETKSDRSCSNEFLPVRSPSIDHDSFLSPDNPYSARSSMEVEKRIPEIGQTPSSSQVARNAAVNGSAEALMAVLKTPVQEKKPKRKPPPSEEKLKIPSYNEAFTSPLLSPREEPSRRHTSPASGYISSRSSIGYDTDSDFVERSDYFSEKPKERSTYDLKFPRYPELTERASEHKLFKRKHKARGSVVNLGDSAYEEDEESDRVVVDKVASQAQPVHLKTTMRKTKKDKKAFNENKPWKNHKELYYISEPERKRYEGVWASNKGMYVASAVTPIHGLDYAKVANPSLKDEAMQASMTAARLSSKANQLDATADESEFHGLKHAEVSDLMHGVVVSRIWKRSRLSPETLAQIWDLVDYRKDGTLNKPEFVVGMWLVDQCLYGRKLPKKVGESIWDSLGSIGVSVAIKRRTRKEKRRA